MNTEGENSRLKGVVMGILIVALMACGGCGGDGGDKVETIQADFDDVVMDEADAKAAKEAAPQPPPGEAPPAPDGEGANGDAALLADMSERERQEFEEKMKPITEAAEIESQNHSVLLGDIQQAVEEYHFDNKKPPAGLADLVRGGYLDSVPKIPAGKKLRIDGKSLEVTLE